MRILRDIASLPERDLGANSYTLSRAGIYRHRAASRPCPRAHSSEADAGGPGLYSDAFSIIADGQTQHVAHVSEFDPDLSRIGVTRHIGERLLGDAE
jgi:hypothetical protein